MGGSTLIMYNGFYQHTLNIESDWVKNQWVMIYIFSTTNLRGFGAYAPGVGI